MKKVLSILLALMMIMSLATTVFAAEGELAPSEATTVTLTKDYAITGGKTFPEETLKFTSSADKGNPDTTNLTIADVKVDAATGVEITVSVPSYSKVGTYKYIIEETEGNTQGVTYSTEDLEILVLVVYDYENKALKIEEFGVAKPENAEKDSVFNNEYDMGSLAVSKTVTGNLGDQDKVFNVDVTFSSTKPVWSAISYSDDGADKTITGEGWTGDQKVTITLKHDETVTFSDIPAGVTYEVKEHDYTDGEKNGENGYDAAQYEFSDENKAIAKEDADTVSITNNKETSIATGVITESAPYIVLIAVCVVAAVLFVIKRRNAYDF